MRYRAIDQATILKVEHGHPQNLVGTGGIIDPNRLRTMEQVVDRLAAALIACREQRLPAP
jgi:hypothetical protein